jgi:hypothetical protein
MGMMFAETRAPARSIPTCREQPGDRDDRSAVLRAGGCEAAHAAFEHIVGDLRLVVERRPSSRREG